MERGYISVTPLSLDLTDLSDLARLTAALPLMRRQPKNGRPRWRRRITVKILRSCGMQVACGCVEDSQGICIQTLDGDVATLAAPPEPAWRRRIRRRMVNADLKGEL
jgi:hypothetical protein